MGFLTGSTKTQATQQTVASGVAIQSSVYGGPIPIVYGQTRLTGNLIWYGNFQAIPPTSNQSSGGKGLGGGGSGGKNGGGTTTTDYKASFAFALGEGPFSAIETVWASKTETAFASSGLGFEGGGAGQAPWGYLTTYHPGQDLAYHGTAYVTAQAYDLGDSAQMPNLSFEITGQGANAIVGQPDADPAFIVRDFLTSAAYGAGFPAARIGDLSVYSNYCRAAGLVISPLFDTQQDAATTLNDIVQQTNAEFVWSGGQLTIVPYGDMALAANGAVYTPPVEALFSLTDDDFLDDGGAGDPVQLVRARPSDRMNSIKLEWLNRGNQYNPEIVEAKDQAAIEIYGLRTNQSQQSHYFCNSAAATMSATLQLQRQAVRNQYSFTLGWKYCLLDPMDIVEISDANLGLVQQWVRILSIEEDDTGNLKITAEEYLGGSGGAPLYSYQTGSPFIANYNTAPGPVNPPMIFEPSGELTGGVPQVWVGASGSANWGGADVWLSVDNATYSRVGRIAGPARQGFLHAPLAANGDPDTVHTLSVDLSESGGALLSGTQADADAFRTLCYADGELIAYETASLTGGYQYGLTYLRRGLFGTTATAHSAGTQFCRLDDAILKIDLPIQPLSYVGQTIYLKLTSYNAYGGGQEALATVHAYAYNPAGTGSIVAPPSACAISVGTEHQPDGTIVPFMEISWAASPDPLFDEYEVQWRLHSGPGAWQSQKLGPNVTSFTVIPVQALTAFDAQVRAIRNKGGPFFSAWAQDLNVSTIFKTSPPPPPTNLSVVGGYRQITIDWAASAENDIAQYEIWESGSSNFGSASRIGLINGTHYARPGLNLSDTRYYWVRAQDTSGNFSSFLGPGVSTTNGVDSADIIGQIVGSQIAANTLAASNLIPGLNVVQVVSTIGAANPATSNVAFAEDTSEIYRWNGNAWVSGAVGIAPGSVDVSAFAAGLTGVQIFSALPASATEGEMGYLTTNGQLYRYHSGAWTAAVPAVNVTGQLTDAQLSGLSAIKITGQLTDSQLADLAAAKITGQLTAVQIAEVNAASIGGQLTDAQLADISAAKVTGQLTSTQIASVNAASLTGQITTTQIANNAITTPLVSAGAIKTEQLAAGSVTSNTIAAGTITGSNIQAGTIAASNIAAGTIISANIAAGTITGSNIQAGTIAASNIAAGTIVSSNIAAGTITAANIAAGSISGDRLTANTITAGQIAAGAITAAQIAAGTITASNIQANTITAYQIAIGTIIAANIQAGAISADRLQANSITAGQIAANAITTGTIAAGAVTAAQIAAGTITANQIAAGTITAAQIQAAGITGDRIAAYTLTANNFAANSVTAAAIQAGTISGDKISGNFFQGNTYYAFDGAGGYALLQGSVFTSSGLLCGPYFGIVDDSGVIRSVVGRWLGKYGIFAWDSTGTPIFTADGIAGDAVGTYAIKPGNVVAQGFATVPYGTYSGGTGLQLIAQVNITLYDNTNVLCFANLQQAVYSGSASAQIYIYVDGADYTGANLTIESTGSISCGAYLSGGVGGTPHTIQFYWNGNSASGVNGSALIVLGPQR